MSKIRFWLATRFWQIFIIVIAVGSLLFLFVKAQPIDLVTHNAVVRNLRELQARDIELGEATFQHHYRMLHNYDGVVAIMRHMQVLGNNLVEYQKNGVLPDTPEIIRELREVQQRIQQKADALEEFKSNNAVLKNSFIYLPRNVNDVLAQVAFINTGWHEAFEFLLRDALLMEVSQDEKAHEALQQSIDVIGQVIPAMPAATQEKAQLALRHARLILEHEDGITSQFALLSSHGKSPVGAELDLLYQDYYQKQQFAASGYRWVLFLAAMAMLGYAIYAYYKMRKEEDELRIAATAFEVQEGILITGADQRIVRVNKAFTQLTGYGAEEMIGRTPEWLESGMHDQQFYADILEALATEGFWEGEIFCRRKNGEVYPAWFTTTAVLSSGNQVTHYVSVFSDITLRKQAEEQIHLLAFYDPLTKLPNRRLLIDRLYHTMTAGARKQEHGALLFIDLDNFKVLNDTKGHDIGDRLLVKTAERLQDCVRGGDTVARLGGDEFIVMLEGLGVEAEHAANQARAVGEKIRNSLNQPYLLGDFEHHSSCSIGISLFRDHEVTLDDLLKRSDTAMYEAKAAGRNALRFFDPSMQTILEQRSMLEADLRRAILQQQFELFYQVQMNAANEPVGAEALIGWRHPERGMVPPLDFIPLAEENGMILPIGRWVLEVACAQIRAWEANMITSKLQLAINVSARQFYQADFVWQVREVLEATGADPSRLKIELTESVVLDNINEAIAKMHDLKRIGVSFAMDDFGTGYSSLAYLTQLPLDQVKIDRSFVCNIGVKATDAVVIQTIIGMSSSLGMRVVAEGVETEEQLAFLKQAGCLVYQGYLFSRPLALAEFERLVLSGGFVRDQAAV